jgi:hypothetical protein
MISMLMVAFSLPLACGTQTADEEDEATATAALRQTSAATDVDTTTTTTTRPPIVKTVAPDVTLQDTIEVPMDVPGGEIAMGDCDQVDVGWRMQPAPAALTGYTTRTIDAGGIVTIATRTYASLLAGIALSVQPGSSFFEYTAAVKDPQDFSNSTGVAALSAAP